jgi:Secretion system C-terminal sorting domain
MKKILLLSFSILLCNVINAQPWMPANHDGPIKFSDALALYPEQLANAEEEDEHDGRGPLKEGKNHLYERWRWYWKQHLDKDGFMLSPMQTLTAWMDYVEATNSKKGAAKTTAITSNWVFQGPHLSGGGYAGIGRVNTVAFDPVDSNTFYVGSAAGSTWKTTDGGHTWNSLYDNLPTLGVADIKINPLNRNTIFVATGDGDGGDAYSSGVIKSHDGGATWSTAGLSWLPTAYYAARSLLINPVDTNSMILATNNGIFKTHNSGAYWTNVAPGNFKQILFKPGDTTIVYGTIYTDTSCQILRSINGGVTWTAVTSFTGAQRINIAVCPADPTIVKAIASNNSSGLKGIYSSNNSGASYTAVFVNDTSCDNNMLSWDLGLPATDCGGQGWYDLCIAINPTNPLILTVGGVNTYYSADGGASWVICNTWWGGLTGVYTVHADKHCLAYNKLTGALFETCDGGVYKNYGPLTEAWTDLSSGLLITEFYRNAVDNGVSFAIGGAQDNGTKKVDIGVSTDLTGGDGMQPLINYGDPANIFYCSTQNGWIGMTRDGGANYHGITDTLHSSGGWVTPYLIHPTDTQTLLLGYKNVFASFNNGNWWYPISPVFNSDAYIDILVMSRKNPNYVYAVYYDYSVWKPVIQYTANFGVSWDTLHIPFTDYISDLVIDPKDAKHFWVTISGYSSTKVCSYNIATSIWTNETGSLPHIPTNCMVIDSTTLTKYVGTDAAVFYKDTTMTDWVLFNNHLPAVHVTDLNINYTSGELWAATFGRGMWKSVKADYNTLSVKPVSKPATVTIVPNPSHGVFTINTTAENMKNGAVTVKLVSADGRVVYETNSVFDGSGNVRICTNGLSAGVYLCEVSNAGNVSRSKVVIY